MAKEVISVEQGIEELMSIIGGAPTKVKPTVVGGGKSAVVTKALDAPKVTVEASRATGATAEVAQEMVWQNGMLVAIDGKKTTTGYVPKKKGTKGGAAKEDAGREALKKVYIRVLQAHPTFGKDTFIHTSEGFIVRQAEADYAIKVSKSKEFKFDPEAEDFEVEKDFTVRGKAVNSAPAIAKALLAAFEGELEFTLISAKASGIIMHFMGGEYTVKISKKRDRVGFQAEKAAAYK